jgi:hypothetical protein
MIYVALALAAVFVILLWVVLDKWDKDNPSSYFDN